jgi:hypothetical protein
MGFQSGDEDFGNEPKMLEIDPALAMVHTPNVHKCCNCTSQGKGTRTSVESNGQVQLGRKYYVVR